LVIDPELSVGTDRAGRHLGAADGLTENAGHWSSDVRRRESLSLSSTPSPTAPVFMRIRLNHFRVWAEATLELSWVESVLQRLPPGPQRGYLNVPLPAPWSLREAVVKVYNRRPKHKLLRRLRPGKAIREARGLQAFAERGLPVTRLLAWGEERTFGLWQRGFIITERVRCATISDTYGQRHESEVFDAGIEQLAAVHRAGLAHGDARACNFFAAGQEAVILDVEAWSRSTPKTRRNDLIRYLGSAVYATGDLHVAVTLADRYQRCTGNALADRAKLLEQAAHYARKEKVMQEAGA